jgi:hypothetical protein
MTANIKLNAKKAPNKITAQKNIAEIIGISASIMLYIMGDQPSVIITVKTVNIDVPILSKFNIP